MNNILSTALVSISVGIFVTQAHRHPFHLIGIFEDEPHDHDMMQMEMLDGDSGEQEQLQLSIDWQRDILTLNYGDHDERKEPSFTNGHDPSLPRLCLLICNGRSCHLWVRNVVYFNFFEVASDEMSFTEMNVSFGREGAGRTVRMQSKPSSPVFAHYNALLRRHTAFALGDPTRKEKIYGMSAINSLFACLMFD